MDPKHSDTDLDLLTEEERDGLLDSDIVDEGLEAGADDDGSDDDTSSSDADGGAAALVEESGNDDTGQDGDAGSAAADAAAQQADSDAAAAAAAKTDETGNDASAVAAEEEERPAGWILPSEVGQKIEELDKARDAIVEQFDDGELTGKEMREKLKPIEKELDGLKEQRTTANVQRDIAIQRYKDETVPDFFKAHPEYADKESPLYGMLDSTLRKLQQSSRDPLSPRLLEKAHEQISGTLKKALGITDTPKPNAPTPAAKQPGKREIPPTLAGIPASDITDADDGGEFAYLDRLSGQDVEKYEAALAKMPDEARERYLAQ